MRNSLHPLMCSLPGRYCTDCVLVASARLWIHGNTKAGTCFSSPNKVKRGSWTATVMNRLPNIYLWNFLRPKNIAAPLSNWNSFSAAFIVLESSGCKPSLSFTPRNLWTDPSPTSTQKYQLLPSGKCYRIPVQTQSLQVLFHSILDRRIKPAHAESVFYPGSAQLRSDRLHVAGLSCCVRLCMYTRVHDSVLLLCVCVKSQKNGQSQLCICVCMYMSQFPENWTKEDAAFPMKLKLN